VMSGFSLDGLTWAFTTFHAGNWHPLTWLSLMLDGQLSGNNPFAYHLQNVVLHALNTALLYLTMASMTGARWRSAFVAACFALHPVHVESVVWISERKDVLSGLFWMLTLYWYGAYVRNPRPRWYLLSLGACLLGLLAKPMLVTMPLILLVLDVWPLQRTTLVSSAPPHDGIAPKRLLLEKVPFLLLSLASSATTLLAQDHGGAVARLSQIPLFLRCYNALWSAVAYVSKLLFPVDLAVYYPYALVPGWKAGCAALLLGLMLATALWRFRASPYLLTGWLYFLITLLPVIGLVQVGSQSMADRYTYIPYIGLFIMIAWGGAEVAGRLRIPVRASAGAAGAALLLLTLVSWNRIGYWRDNERLLLHTLEVTRHNYFVHRVLADLYDRQEKPELALAHYQEVVRINPNAKLIHLALGTFLARRGSPASALEYLDEAVRRDARNNEAHFYRGVVLERLGRDGEALTAYREALAISPGIAVYHTNAGSVLARQKRYEEALRHFSRALTLNPADRKAQENLQLALKLIGPKVGQ
jgi:Tfp pilus assembly protein PilF